MALTGPTGGPQDKITNDMMTVGWILVLGILFFFIIVEPFGEWLWRIVVTQFGHGYNA